MKKKVLKKAQVGIAVDSSKFAKADSSGKSQYLNELVSELRGYLGSKGVDPKDWKKYFPDAVKQIQQLKKDASRYTPKSRKSATGGSVKSKKK